MPPSLESKLSKAAEHGRLKEVKSAVAAGANINYATESQMPPLHAAACSDHKAAPDVVRFLLASGANVEDKVWGSALFWSAHSLPATEALVNQGGANLETKCKRLKQTPLIRHCGTAGPRDAVGFLIAAGSDVSAKDKAGFTALHLAVDMGPQEHSVAIARRLLDAGADINATSKAGWTPLHRACMLPRNQEKIVLFLINAGADLEIKSKRGKKPLSQLTVGNQNKIRIMMEAQQKEAGDSSTHHTPPKSSKMKTGKKKTTTATTTTPTTTTTTTKPSKQSAIGDNIAPPATMRKKRRAGSSSSDVPDDDDADDDDNDDNDNVNDGDGRRKGSKSLRSNKRRKRSSQK
eukprot:TRINITY_DN1567_c0_g1_i1.p1 TRINITY_DN1567_c0_g1~~TRINITY_DN1567_c0_g1_i1.p1  ORF type:complete len:348 (-),score=72.32 TRINITY_DN1567_c0_g1_i1:31-1074(-)